MRPRASRCRTAARASRSAARPGRRSHAASREATVPGSGFASGSSGAAGNARGVTPSASRRPAPVVICKPSFRETHSPCGCPTRFALLEQDSRDALEDIARNARISSWSTAAPGSPARDAATRSGRSSAGRVLRGPPAGAAARPSSWWRRWRGCRRWAACGGWWLAGRTAPAGGSGPRCGSGRGGESDRRCGSGREGESDRRYGSGREGEIDTEVRVGPGRAKSGRRYGSGRRARVGPEVRVGPGRVGWVAVAAGCETCQGPSHRSRRVHISIPTMLMCTQRDRVNPPCHALHNGDPVRSPML